MTAFIQPDTGYAPIRTKPPTIAQRLAAVERGLLSGYSLAQLGHTQESYLALKSGSILVTQPHQLTYAEQVKYDELADEIEKAKLEAIETGSFISAGLVELEAQQKFTEFQKSQEVKTLTDEQVIERKIARGEITVPKDRSIKEQILPVHSDLTAEIFHIDKPLEDTKEMISVTDNLKNIFDNNKWIYPVIVIVVGTIALLGDK